MASKKKKKKFGSPASKFGQIIGQYFEKVVITLVKDHVEATYPAYKLLEPTEGKQIVRLEMLGGSFRQLDTVL